MLYTALSRAGRGEGPRDIATDYYDRALVRAQLRKELRYLRNVDMFALLAAHVTRHPRVALVLLRNPLTVVMFGEPKWL